MSIPKKVTHIDGLSGEEEYKAMEMLNEEREQHMLQSKMCPECESELEEVGQAIGPDAFEATGLVCTECKYQYDY